MTETNQHQEPLRRAQEASEQAIKNAQRAELALQSALTAADPQQIFTARDQLHSAKLEADEAMQQLKFQASDTQQQQVVETLEQLDQGLQDLEAAEEKTAFPKQIR